VWTAALGLFALTACQLDSSFQNQKQPMDSLAPTTIEANTNNQPMETLTLGAGCFWCVEAVFEQVKGVSKVRSGYMGGQVAQPTYREVCTGRTGHAEVVQFAFDSSVVSMENLLEIFFGTHDPTTLNRQGEDVGTQYRSVIFYRGEEQRKTATEFVERLQQDNPFGRPVVTEIAEAGVFYVAENYHQEYFRLHGEEPYCKLVVRPKVEKFQKAFERFRR
jgi:peptide-methionine (S)-S-oxide reductase